MDRRAVALVLAEIATLLELHGENRFKVRAYSTAARAIESSGDELDALIEEGRLGDLPGVGPATRAVIEELVGTGSSTLHEELLGRTPDGFFALLAVPGLGPGRIHKLHEALGIEGPRELESAAREGRVAAVKGFGPKLQATILEGLRFVEGTAARRLQPSAYEAAERVVGVLEDLPGVASVRLAGEIRRRLETLASADLLVEVTEGAEEPVAAAVRAALAGLPGTTEEESDDGGEWIVLRLSDGFRLRVACAPTARFGVAWIDSTGSPEHVRALRAFAGSSGSGGLATVTGREEEGVYRAIGLPWIPPELREDGSEVEAAAAGTLPELIQPSDLRGCFHNHTTRSDGSATLVEMAAAAIARGWRYLGIADHSRAAAYAGGLTTDRIRRQHEEIDAWNAERGDELWIFKGIEADILPDGRVDLADDPDDVLASMDYVVASVHSSFGLDRDAQTRRILRALENPCVTILGHATGRLLLRRDGYALDLESVIRRAAEAGVAMEINANPRRLELDWRHWRFARELGVRAAVNPDAHSTRELGNVVHGVGIARKGWLSAGDVVNAWDLDRVREFFASRKAALP